jgi:site-specific recombinase XerD
MKSVTLTSEDNPSQGLVDLHLDPFIEHLRAAGFAKRTLRKKRRVVADFARWARLRQVQVEEFDQSLLVEYVARWGGKRSDRVEVELAALRPFLEFLRAKKAVPHVAAPITDSPADALFRDYVSYLSNERGLAPNSIAVYSPFIRDFLNDCAAGGVILGPCAIDAQKIRGFLLDHSVDRPSEYARLLATALRSFSHFLFLRGFTSRDLSLSVPSVRTFRPITMQAILTPEDVERVIAAPDRSTPRGRRDHAILLLLARLGLRAGEVVALELNDIRWRAGELTVRGKGRMLERLPLLADVGEALALYLHTDRGASTSRRVFLRFYAPRVGLTGPASIGHVVRRALARAGLRPSGRSAAHLFRHSLATRMVRHGASLPEISVRGSPASLAANYRHLRAGVV